MLYQYAYAHVFVFVCVCVCVCAEFLGLWAAQAGSKSVDHSVSVPCDVSQG